MISAKGPAHASGLTITKNIKKKKKDFSSYQQFVNLGQLYHRPSIVCWCIKFVKHCRCFHHKVNKLKPCLLSY